MDNILLLLLLGLYFTASLFVIHSKTLLSMHGGEVKSWIEEISTNSKNWFKNICNKLNNNIFPTWDDFMKGWISATSGLII